MAQGSKLVVDKIDATIESDATAAIDELSTKHGIKHLDVIIANTGISYVWPTVAELKLADLDAHIRTNACSLVSVFQATRALLRASPALTPVFARMGTSVASIR